MKPPDLLEAKRVAALPISEGTPRRSPEEYRQNS